MFSLHHIIKSDHVQGIYFGYKKVKPQYLMLREHCLAVIFYELEGQTATEAELARGRSFMDFCEFEEDGDPAPQKVCFSLLILRNIMF
jgi:hypothetical protein